MWNQLLQTESAWTWFALDTCVKATLLVLVAALFALAFGRSSAALRHRVWSLMFVALLVLPVANLALPGMAWRVIPREWRVAKVQSPTPAIESTRPSDVADASAKSESTQAIPATNTTSDAQESTVTTSVTKSETFAAPVVESPRAAMAPAAAPAAPPAPRTAIPWLPLIWIAGVVAFLVPLICGIACAARLKNRGERVTDPQWRLLVDELSETLGLNQRVALLLSPTDQTPLMLGVTQPCIVLPASAVSWPDEKRRVVLLHELAHIRRRDVAWQIVARAACALYWFHPLVWLALRAMRKDREHACDDCVLLAGQKASSYATHLLEIARVHKVSSPLATAALAMARPSQLEGRLLAVLDSNRRRAPLTARRAFALLLLTCVIVLSLGVIRPALQTESAALAAGDASPAATSDTVPAGMLLVTGVVRSSKGEPVAGAQVELLALDNSEWPIYRTRPEQIEYEMVSTDAAGRFKTRMPRNSSGSFPSMMVLVNAEGFAPKQKWCKLQERLGELSITLTEPKTVRIQLVDSIGNPLPGIEPIIRGGGFWIWSEESRAAVKNFPRFTLSNAEGITSIVLGSDATDIGFVVEDERVGRQVAHYAKIASDPTVVALAPGLVIRGVVTAEDTGDPISGAEVLLLERPFRRVKTAADGSYRLLSSYERSQNNDVGIQVYPPQGSPFLFHSLETKRPRERASEIEANVKLSRGIILEGNVLERASRQPVGGADVYFVPQRRDNPYFKNGWEPQYAGTQMNYATDSNGHFRMVVAPGPGYLFVEAPTHDFVHVMVSDGDTNYGKPGLERNYYDGALKIDFKPGEKPAPVKIELERGVTLKRKVVRPDGQPANAVLYSRSYLLDAHAFPGFAPALPVQKGVLELPGFAPDQSNPLFLLDLEHHSGLAYSPDNAADDGAPVQLIPCGSAKLRFLDEENKPVSGFDFQVILVVTPGALVPRYIEPDQPLWSDNLVWQNVIRPEKIPMTDADGRAEFQNLIAGAKYYVWYVHKKKQRGYSFHEFTVRPNETTDIGDIVIPRQGTDP